MQKLLITFCFLLLTLLVGCASTTQNAVKETITIKEKVFDPSFRITGTAKQDTIRSPLYLWDTALKIFNKFDTIRTTFNEITKLQTLQLISQPDTVRDTTYIREASQTKVITQTPTWAWWCLIIVIIELVILLVYIMYKNKIWLFK